MATGNWQLGIEKWEVGSGMCCDDVACSIGGHLCCGRQAHLNSAACLLTYLSMWMMAADMEADVRLLERLSISNYANRRQTPPDNVLHCPPTGLDSATINSIYIMLYCRMVGKGQGQRGDLTWLAH